MSYKLLVFLIASFAGVLAWNAIGMLQTAPQADRDNLNALYDTELVQSDDVTFGTSPLQTLWTGLKVTGNTLKALVTLAAFRNVFVDGDLQAVQFLLLGSLGSAFIVYVGWRVVELIRG